MDKEQLLQIINEAWDKHLYTQCTEHILGHNSWIEGKEDFIQEIVQNITILS